MEQEIQDFYSIVDFAKKLKVHPNTIRRAIKSGRICAFKLGTEKKSTYRIPHNEIDRIIIGDMRKLIKKLIQEENEIGI